MNPIYPMGILKKKVSEAFNIPLKNFILKSRDNRNKMVDSDDDDIMFNEFGIVKAFTV